MDTAAKELQDLLKSGEWEVYSVSVPIREIEPQGNWRAYERIGVAVVVLTEKKQRRRFNWNSKNTCTLKDSAQKKSKA